MDGDAGIDRHVDLAALAAEAQRGLDVADRATAERQRADVDRPLGRRPVERATEPEIGRQRPGERPGELVPRQPGDRGHGVVANADGGGELALPPDAPAHLDGAAAQTAELEARHAEPGVRGQHRVEPAR